MNSGGNVLIFCTKLIAVSSRDEIRFCAEMQKAVSCIAKSCCDHVVFNTLLDPANGNSFSFLLVFSVCHLGEEN